MRLDGRRGRTARLRVLEWRSDEAGTSRPLPGPRWSVTFDSRGSTRTFHAFQRAGVDEGLWRARTKEGDTAELHSNGATVDLDFGGKGRVVHRYYTRNKTKPFLGEQGRVLIGVGGGHHSKDVTAVVRWHV